MSDQPNDNLPYNPEENLDREFSEMLDLGDEYKIPEDKTEEESSEDVGIVSDPIALVVYKTGEPVIIGHAVVSYYEDRTEIVGRLDDSDNGRMFGGFLASGAVGGLSLGAILDEEVAKRINAQRN